MHLTFKQVCETAKNGQIIESLINDLIKSSKDKEEIMFSPEKHKLMVQLKDFN